MNKFSDIFNKEEKNLSTIGVQEFDLNLENLGHVNTHFKIENNIESEGDLTLFLVIKFDGDREFLVI